MARGDAVADHDDVTRWVKPKFVGKDDDGEVLLDEYDCPKFVAPAAFALALDEDGLSVTWLQQFGTGRAVHMRPAAEAFRSSIPSKKLSGKSAFAIATAGDVLAEGKKNSHKLRILHDPVDGNEGHTEIRRYPAEMGLLQLALATETFRERYLYQDISKKDWAPIADRTG
jgi:hypothetical protein